MHRVAVFWLPGCMIRTGPRQAWLLVGRPGRPEMPDIASGKPNGSVAAMTSTNLEGSREPDPAYDDFWEDDEEVDDLPDSYAEAEPLLPG